MTTTVLVTRPLESSQPLVRALEQAGLGTRPVPTVSLAPVDPSIELRPALATLDATDWLVVTSTHGARVVCREFELLERDVRPRVAAIGASTARALAEGGLPVAAVAPLARAEALVAAMEARGPLMAGRVLLARSDAASADIPEALAAADADVRSVVAYHTVVGPESSRRSLRRALGDPLVRIAMFASGSAVNGAIALAGRDASRLRGLQAVTVGPATTTIAQRVGLTVAAEADRPDLESQVAAVLFVAGSA